MPRKSFLTACLKIVSCGACRQLQDAGRDLPACRGLGGSAEADPPDEVLTSRLAGEQYDNAVEACGEEGPSAGSAASSRRWGCRTSTVRGHSDRESRLVLVGRQAINETLSLPKLQSELVAVFGGDFQGMLIVPAFEIEPPADATVLVQEVELVVHHTVHVPRQSSVSH